MVWCWPNPLFWGPLKLEGEVPAYPLEFGTFFSRGGMALSTTCCIGASAGVSKNHRWNRLSCWLFLATITVTPVRAFAQVLSWQAEDLGLCLPSLQESNSLSASAGFFCTVFSVEMMRWVLSVSEGSLILFQKTPFWIWLNKSRGSKCFKLES